MTNWSGDLGDRSLFSYMPQFSKSILLLWYCSHMLVPVDIHSVCWGAEDRGGKHTFPAPKSSQCDGTLPVFHSPSQFCHLGKKILCCRCAQFFKTGVPNLGFNVKLDF